MSIATLACADSLGFETPSSLSDVTYLEHLCSHPDLRHEMEDANRLVMVVHRAHLALALVQRQARVLGIDPLGIQMVDAESIGGDPQRASILLAGARARATEYAGSEPENARPVFGTTLSRRQLLTVPKPHYESVPLIDRNLCAADSGCRACTTECPQAAYRWVGGRMTFDKDACVACGRCITACPTGAVGNPTISAGTLRAQITAMLDASPTPIGIAFVCRRRNQHLNKPGWFEVELPCTGMAPATWLAATLLLGAAAVTLLPCSENGCDLGNDILGDDALELARNLLISADLEPERIPDECGVLPTPLDHSRLDDPFGVHGAVETVLALAARSPTGRGVSGAGQRTQLGIVEVDPSACTICLTCVETCPTGALTADRPDGKVALVFDGSLCTGCAQCVPACPEIQRGAIKVRRAIDSTLLSAGRRQLAESNTPECELCGQPIASEAMLNRIGTLLGEDHAPALTVLKRRCMDCRGVG